MMTGAVYPVIKTCCEATIVLVQKVMMTPEMNNLNMTKTTKTKKQKTPKKMMKMKMMNKNKTVVEIQSETNMTMTTIKVGQKVDDQEIVGSHLRRAETVAAMVNMGW